MLRDGGRDFCVSAENSSTAVEYAESIDRSKVKTLSFVSGGHIHPRLFELFSHVIQLGIYYYSSIKEIPPEIRLMKNLKKLLVYRGDVVIPPEVLELQHIDRFRRNCVDVGAEINCYNGTDCRQELTRLVQPELNRRCAVQLSWALKNKIPKDLINQIMEEMI